MYRWAAQYCCNSPAECTSFQSTPALPASCVTRPAIGCWDAPNTTTCTAGVNQYCCASAGDCTNLQSGSATLPGGKQDPTAQCGGTGINTAIGCIPFTDTTDFVGHIFQFAIGIGGGIAFLLIVYSGFLIMTSTGNPERLQQGKELMTSAISGLILLIFSVFVLKLLGVNILKLPGFGS